MGRRCYPFCCDRFNHYFLECQARPPEGYANFLSLPRHHAGGRDRDPLALLGQSRSSYRTGRLNFEPLQDPQPFEVWALRPVGSRLVCCGGTSLRLGEQGGRTRCARLSMIEEGVMNTTTRPPIEYIRTGCRQLEGGALAQCSFLIAGAQFDSGYLKQAVSGH